MLRSMLAVLAVLAASPMFACSDACIDGICPPVDLSTHYPGPCESAVEGERYSERCTYRYDEARIVDVECEWFDDELGGGGMHTTTWTYEPAGELARVEKVQRDTQARVGWAWQLDADPILYYEYMSPPDDELREVAAYDRATFAFMPAPAGEEFPTAEVGLLRRGSTTFAWSGSGTLLTRTGSDGSVVTFELDDRGRVVHEQAASRDERWTFGGDALDKYVYDWGAAGSGERNYLYDRHVNIAMKTTSSRYEPRRVYAYDCW